MASINPAVRLEGAHGVHVGRDDGHASPGLVRTCGSVLGGSMCMCMRARPFLRLVFGGRPFWLALQGNQKETSHAGYHEI